MEKVILENFRCFKDYCEIDLKPLTFLVGENSTGKTSFLAAICYSLEMLSFRGGLDFNKEPFNLGAFEQIASFVGGKKGRARYFKIGLETSLIIEDKPDRIKIIASYTSQKGLPVITEINISDMSRDIEYKSTKNIDTGKIEVVQRSGTEISKHVMPDELSQLFPFISFHEFESFLRKKYVLKHMGNESRSIIHRTGIAREESYAIAPVRTKPERTYDPKSDLPRPEGNHIPITLRQISKQPDKWENLIRDIKEFGNKSGLFKEILVRSLGGEADPFQIRIKIAGSPNNLIDVGYGVSQVLPILIDTILRKERIFLMQQPEIHLHPRAQAELGTFLGLLAAKRKKQFIIETHSDYILDRISLDIRDNKIGLQPDDVQILFFQRPSLQPWIKVEKINIDQFGNIKNAPNGYRDFFLKEQARLFSLDKNNNVRNY